MNPEPCIANIAYEPIYDETFFIETGWNHRHPMEQPHRRRVAISERDTWIAVQVRRPRLNSLAVAAVCKTGSENAGEPIQITFSAVAKCSHPHGNTINVSPDPNWKYSTQTGYCAVFEHPMHPEETTSWSPVCTGDWEEIEFRAVSASGRLGRRLGVLYRDEWQATVEPGDKAQSTAQE